MCCMLKRHFQKEHSTDVWRKPVSLHSATCADDHLKEGSICVPILDSC
jgi:hypothetical protein